MHFAQKHRLIKTASTLVRYMNNANLELVSHPTTEHARSLISWLVLFLFSFATYFAKWWNLWVDYWLPYDLARYAPDVIPLQCNGPNTTWDHEANLDYAVCYKTHESPQHWSGRDTERGGSFDLMILFQETNMNMWQEGSILPVKLLIIFTLPMFLIFVLNTPPHHGWSQVPSDKVQIRTNSEGVQMVFGTCPILVEGNEYIFRCRIMINVIMIENHQTTTIMICN